MKLRRNRAGSGACLKGGVYMTDNQSRVDPRIEELLEYLYLREYERNGAPADALPGDFDRQLIQQAADQGFLNAPSGSARLTERGCATGRDVVRRHRLAECLLRDVLGVHTPDITEDACRIEHIIQHGLDEKICILLGHPKFCPHGKPIPPGACCKRAQEEDLREVKPLCEGKPQETGIVAYLSTRENREIQKLMAMGILPGNQVKLIQRYPSYVFQMGYSQFTIDRDLAEKIYVHWQTSGG